MHSKGPNGTNVPDEFSFGKLPELPSQSRGRVAEPLDLALVEKIRTALVGDQDAVNGRILYSATTEELVAYNAAHAAAEGFVPVTSLEVLAKRFATNAASRMKRHVDVVAKERGMTSGIRTVNEGDANVPAIRWYVVITKPRPRTIEPTKA
jgi:hypothetical protein